MENKDLPPVHRSCVLALFLANHPDRQVLDGDTLYVWDSEKRYFLCRKPSNKVRNNWMRARGLDAFLREALKLEGI